MHIANNRNTLTAIFVSDESPFMRHKNGRFLDTRIAVRETLYSAVERQENGRFVDSKIAISEAQKSQVFYKEMSKVEVVFTKAQVAAFEKYFGWRLGDMEKGRDFSKLCPKVITDKNGRAMTVYVRREEAPKSGRGSKTRIEKQREAALSAMANNAVRMRYVRYDETTYKRLFPNKRIETKIGEVKLGEKQFERLAGKDGGARTNLLGAMYQTLKYPCVVFTDTDAQGRDANLFVKTFENEGKRKTTIAVVAVIDGVLVSVSFGIRKENAIKKKIKNARHFHYIAKPKEKESGRTNGTAHAAGVAHPDAIKGSRNSSSATLPQTGGAVNKNSKKVKKSAKSKKWIWIDSNGKVWIRKSVLKAWQQGMAE